MGYRIKEIRQKQGMSQQELSEKSGVSRAIISNLESGKTEQTTVRTLLKIAKALKSTVDEIFFEDVV